MFWESRRFTSMLGLAAVLSLACVLLSRTQTVLAYTSESPEVQAMVKKAMAYLQTAQHSEPGGTCLIGLAFLKTGSDQSHPKVQEAINQAQRLAREVAERGVGLHCYNEGIACIFLCEAEPRRYQTDIQALLRGLVQRQQSNGTWGYKPHSYDDTSQTQYGMLALWTAHGAGISAPVASVERAMHWLMRTQLEDGGFAYNPGDPGSGQMKGRGKATLSMSAAGLGSLYVGAHLLGLGAKAKVEKKKDEPTLPPALRRVNAKEEKQEFQPLRPQTVSVAMVQRATSAGNAWFDKNFGPENSDARFTYYYLYGLERYKSFMEIVEGDPMEEPEWYNVGVEYLREKQRDNGSWTCGMVGAGADTAFAVLFLARGTKKSIRKAVLNEGVLVGGHGFPKNITNITMKDGKVVTPQMVREMDEWLEMLEGAEDKEFDPEAMEGMSLDDDLTQRTSQLERLRKLVSNEDWRARRVAVRTLATARELDNVPILIYALTDKDSEVPMYARDGLRFISRKFKGFGMPDRATPGQKQAAADKWKKWYLSIRPDGELLD